MQQKHKYELPKVNGLIYFWPNLQQTANLNIQNHFTQKELIVKMDRKTQVMYNKKN